jgi:hypothetical protein
MLTRLSLTFAAGVVGGLANSLALWLAGRLGLTQALGVALAPMLTPAWLYPRLVWGGLWAWLLLAAVPGRSPVSRGLLVSLPPSLAQLLYFFPFRFHKGWLGLELGWLTPLLVLAFNALWGMVTAGWLAYVAPRPGKS